ncbi:hypothetical protein ACWEF9_14635 [Streptomyces sp. NPDC004980]
MAGAGARVVVRPDNAVYRKRLALYGVVGVPALCSLGALLIGEFGIGWLVPSVVLIVLPVVAVLVMTALRSSLAQVAVVEDELRIDNAFGVSVYRVPVEFLTGLHPITFGAGPLTPTPGRMVITSDVARPFVLDMRPWQRADTERLARRLRGIPVSDSPASSPKELRTAFPGVRLPWWHAHPWGVVVLHTALVVGYFLAASALMGPSD